jgi:hypothetical protein
MTDIVPTFRHGLSQLRSVTLSPRHQQMLEQAAVGIGGPAAWRERKQIEAYELLALAQTSLRLSILQLDLSCDLRAVVAMKATVPCMPHPGGPVRIMPYALLAVQYPEEAIRQPQRGSNFAAILQPGPPHPGSVWHGNVSAEPPQVICLGASLPAGIPVREILLMIYGALTFQGVVAELDERNPGGVLNPEAARYWQERCRELPMNKEPFYMEAA